MAMLLTDKQYKLALLSIERSKKREEELKEKYKNDKKALKQMLEMESISLIPQIKDEVKEYENIKAGKFPAYMKKLENIGYLLIALRIHKGWSQSELAKKLNIKPSQVCRNERNEYYGVSMPTVRKMLKVFDCNINMEIS